MAEVHRLNRFDDLSIIDKYAARFARDPDEVYACTEFNTVLNFCVMWKEMDEYNERFSYIWSEIQAPPARK